MRKTIFIIRITNKLLKLERFKVTFVPISKADFKLLTCELDSLHLTCSIDSFLYWKILLLVVLDFD